MKILNTIAYGCDYDKNEFSDRSQPACVYRKVVEMVMKNVPKMLNLSGWLVLQSGTKVHKNQQTIMARPHPAHLRRAGTVERSTPGQISARFEQPARGLNLRRLRAGDQLLEKVGTARRRHERSDSKVLKVVGCI